MLTPIVVLVFSQYALGAANTCGPPPEIERTNTPDLTDEENALGTEVEYKCSSGYIKQGNKKFTSVCELDADSGTANWTDPHVRCNGRSCGDPGHVDNARRKGAVFTFPEKVEYECDEGYKLKGQRARYCQPSGAWSGRLPNCEEIFCNPPSNPDNGKANYDSLEFGAELRYVCNKGFKLENYEPRHCTEKGTWSNEDPLCTEVHCDKPETPKYGSMQMVGDKTAFFTCDVGKELIGQSTIKCEDDGQWLFPPPKCVGPCTIPDIENGNIGRGTNQNFKSLNTDEKVNYGDTVTFRCKEDFVPQDNFKVSDELNYDLQIKCGDDGWSANLTCKSVSCHGEPPSIENGHPIVHKRRHKHGVDYECNDPYVITKRGNIHCFYGRWTGEIPECTDLSCYEEPPSIENGHPVIDKRTHEHIIKYECNDSHVMTKQGSVRCFAGNWTGELPECTFRGCIVPDVANGTIGRYEMNNSADPYEAFIPLEAGVKVLHNKMVIIRCNEDFVPEEKFNASEELNFELQVKCEAGNWSSSPMCKSVSCLEDPPAVENGYAAVMNRTHKHVVRYMCNRNYVMTKEGRIECFYGNWTGQTPLCSAVSCLEDPPPIENGHAVVVNWTHEHVVQYRCNENYMMTREGRIKCFYGNWTGETPVCSAVPCLKKPPSIENGYAVVSKLTHGHVVHYECNKDYAFTKQGRIECINGMWMGETPVCQKFSTSSGAEGNAEISFIFGCSIIIIIINALMQYILYETQG